MDIEYWNDYYDAHGEPFTPSDFAKFVMHYLTDDDSIVDLGCGNGRDTIFFGSHDITSVGIDQCENIVNGLNLKEYANVEFSADDFTNPKGNYYAKHAYSRFTLHSIPEDAEDRVIKWVKETIPGYFFIEVRSDQDILAGKTTDHYRRFANIDKLIGKLIDNGFSIRYAEISRGFSKYDKNFEVDYNEDDPMLIRIVANVNKEK